MKRSSRVRLTARPGESRRRRRPKEFDDFRRFLTRVFKGSKSSGLRHAPRRTPLLSALHRARSPSAASLRPLVGRPKACATFFAADRVDTCLERGVGKPT